MHAASLGRRVTALFVDWFMAAGAVLTLGGSLQSPVWPSAVLGAWFFIGVLSVTLFSFTPGQFILGMAVIRVDGPVRVGFWRAVARSVFIVFVVPALFTDSHGRGMHDRATGTALMRTR